MTSSANARRPHGAGRLRRPPARRQPDTLDHKWLRNASTRCGSTTRRTAAPSRNRAPPSAPPSPPPLPPRCPRCKSKVIVLITDGASNSGKISPSRPRKTPGRSASRSTHRHRHQGRSCGSQHHALSLSGIRPPHAAQDRRAHWCRTLLGAEPRSLKQTFTTIDQLEKTDAKSYTVIEDTELFPWFLGVTLLAAFAAPACWPSIRPIALIPCPSPNPPG